MELEIPTTFQQASVVRLEIESSLLRLVGLSTLQLIQRERGMDFSLAALKLLCGQLKHAKETTSPSAMTLGGILFQRAWLQGVLVSGCEEGRFVLDDGSGIIELVLSKDSLPQEWKTGMYVMVVGLYVARSTGDLPLIKVHKIVDLSPFPDREALWLLEVIEANKLFYLSSSEE